MDTNTLMSLQNLAVTVNGLKESIDLTATRVSSISNSNNNRASQYHSRFSELLSKYSSFAVNYKFELDNLHKSLLNDINLQQKERERQEREFQEKLESLSNKSTHSNLEIVENVEETEYNSSANSVNNMSSLPPNSPQQYESDTNTNANTNTVSMEIPTTLPSNPQPMKSKKSVPISKPTPKRKSNTNNNSHKSKKSNKKKGKSPAAPKSKVTSKTQTKKASKPLVVRTVTADIEKKEQEQKNEAQVPEENKYVYRADKIRFEEKFEFRVLDEETGKYKDIDYKHTTMVYIGNVPSNIKVAAVQFFVMKKFKVTMRQIEETKLMKGRGYTQSALVRFRCDVGLDKITKCMEMVNSENAQIKEDKKKAKDTMHVSMKKSSKTDAADDKKKGSKKKLRTSWQTRVFIKFQDPEYHYSYYETEDDMYNDQRAKHSLFIRNFDILDKNCHKQLTDLLLKFGDLVKDINIRLDAYGDPFCVVIFKYLNEAIYCCNSDVYFNGKRLEMRYSKF